MPAQVTRALTNDVTLTPVALEEVSTKIVAAIDLIASLIPTCARRIQRRRRRVREGRAMDAYMMAKRFAKERRYADLAEHVAVMARHLYRSNASTAKKK